MKLLAIAGLVLLGSCVADTGWQHGLYLQAGARQLQDEWQPVDDQFVYGAEWTARPEGVAVGVEVGGTYASSDGTALVSDGGGGEVSADLDLDVLEVYFGPRVTIEAGAARPYLGVGVSYLEADGEAALTMGGEDRVVDFEDATFGAYARVGSDFLIGPHFSLGVDVRYLFLADFEEQGVDLDGDALQVTGRIGWSF